jgi:hypothetical protein
MSSCAIYPVPGAIAGYQGARGRRHPGIADEASLRVPGLARDIRVKIATELIEFKEAFELLAANYGSRGYDSESEKPYRFTPSHALPGTIMLVAKHEGHVVATFSLVPDNAILGLPMECIYGEEVEQLRKEGRRLGEAISLADSGLTAREFIQVFKAMIKLVMQYHKSRGGDAFVIVVNPRHSSFYQKVLGFTSLGPERSYPTVQNHPAEAYVLDIERMKTSAPRFYQEVFGEDLPESLLKTSRWSALRVRIFGRQSSQIDEEALEELLDKISETGGRATWE